MPNAKYDMVRREGNVNETMKPKVVLGKSSSRDLKKKCKSSISQAKKEARVWKKCLAL